MKHKAITFFIVITPHSADQYKQVSKWEHL